MLKFQPLQLNLIFKDDQNEGKQNYTRSNLISGHFIVYRNQINSA